MIFPREIDNCASCRCGVDVTEGSQRYCNRCERTLCEDKSCQMETADCPIIPSDEVWCSVCAGGSMLAASALMRDVRSMGALCA